MVTTEKARELPDSTANASSSSRVIPSVVVEEEQAGKASYESFRHSNSPVKIKKNDIALSQLREVTSSFCIGDFTDNSLLYTGEEVVHVPRKGDQGTSDAEHSLTDTKCLLELFKQLNFKLDAISHWKSAEKLAIDNAYFLLEIGDYTKAQQILRAHSRTSTSNDCCSLLHSFIRSKTEQEMLAIGTTFVKIKALLARTETLLSKTIDHLLYKTDENSKLQEMIKKQHDEHIDQMSAVVAENSKVKAEMIKLLSVHSPGLDIKSQLEEDLVEAIRIRLTKYSEDERELKQRLDASERELERYRAKEQDLEVCSLRGKLIASRRTVQSLEAQLASFSEAVRKLSEKNSVLSKELYAEKEEVRRLTKAMEVKNETVMRQRALIQLFQNKLGGSCSLTIEELRRRKEKIQQRIALERDFVKRDALIREAADCERRLSDFLRLQERSNH